MLVVILQYNTETADKKVCKQQNFAKSSLCVNLKLLATTAQITTDPAFTQSVIIFPHIHRQHIPFESFCSAHYCELLPVAMEWHVVIHDCLCKLCLEPLYLRQIRIATPATLVQCLTLDIMTAVK